MVSDLARPDLELQIRPGSDIVKLHMTYVSKNQLVREMSQQLNTVLIISHKHSMNTNSTDSMLLLSLLHDIREALYFENISFPAVSWF